jgi:hypothetical protein
MDDLLVEQTLDDSSKILLVFVSFVVSPHCSLLS